MSSGKKRPLEDEFQSDDDQKDRKRAASTSCNFDFIITERQRRVIPYIKTSKIYDIYEVKASYSPMTLDFVKVDEGLKRLFGEVLEKVSEDLNPDDMMKICIHSITFVSPISTGMLPLDEMTPEKILSCIGAAVPSGSEIPLHEPLNIDVIIAKSP